MVWTKGRATGPTTGWTTATGLTSKTIEPTNPATAAFGFRTSISGDGTKCLVSALGSKEVFYYINSGGTWTTPQTIIPPGVVPVDFGFGLALSEDGKTAVIGAYGANKVFVSKFSGGAFPTATELVPAAGVVTADLGQSVAVSAAGEVIVSGSPATNGLNGAALVFMWGGTSYAAGEQLVPATIGGELGYSIAISSDGFTVAAGQPGIPPGPTPGAVTVWLNQ